ncbi:hypothetical protein BaRGS_00021767 [Batillaria attramentaria]|uniref:Uncharacterized protein n=1 Tax=Batillaria attramentaria TaxID=370345 RepID=A0ABD0KIZ1_9CAEN
MLSYVVVLCATVLVGCQCQNLPGWYSRVRDLDNDVPEDNAQVIQSNTQTRNAAFGAPASGDNLSPYPRADQNPTAGSQRRSPSNQVPPWYSRVRGLTNNLPDYVDQSRQTANGYLGPSEAENSQNRLNTAINSQTRSRSAGQYPANVRNDRQQASNGGQLRSPGAANVRNDRQQASSGGQLRSPGAANVRNDRHQASNGGQLRSPGAAANRPARGSRPRNEYSDPLLSRENGPVSSASRQRQTGNYPDLSAGGESSRAGRQQNPADGGDTGIVRVSTSVVGRDSPFLHFLRRQQQKRGSASASAPATGQIPRNRQGSALARTLFGGQTRNLALGDQNRQRPETRDNRETDDNQNQTKNTTAHTEPNEPKQGGPKKQAEPVSEDSQTRNMAVGDESLQDRGSLQDPKAQYQPRYQGEGAANENNEKSSNAQADVVVPDRESDDNTDARADSVTAEPELEDDANDLKSKLFANLGGHIISFRTFFDSDVDSQNQLRSDFPPAFQRPETFHVLERILVAIAAIAPYPKDRQA